MQTPPIEFEIPDALVPVFDAPRGEMRWRGAYGGRGSGKSVNFATVAAIWGSVEPLRILCTRDLQASIKESFHAELKAAIAENEWLTHFYDVGVDYLRGKNGTEFMFRGLRHNMSAIKSTAHIDLCIVEEAEDVPEKSWVELIPTIRAPKSEIWVLWNPREKGSPVDLRLRQNSPPRSCIVEMNHRDNPWFPDVLEEERLANQATFDDALYRHIWEGDYYEQSDAQIFRNKYRVEEFTAGGPGWDGPYYGLDWGFSQDPTAGVKCWIFGNTLCIEYEAGKVGLELDDTPEFLRQGLPDIERHTVRADSARPESIRYVQRHGIPQCVGVEKGKGSVEDGIEFIKSFSEVIIHPRCTETIREFRYYSYKIDRLSGDVLPVIVDKFNHFLDATRYALEPMMKARGKVGRGKITGF